MANYGQALKDSKDGNWEKVVENLDIEESWRYPVSVGICETDEFKEIFKVVTEGNDSSVFEELDDQLITLFENVLDGSCTPHTGEEAVQILREQSFNDWNHHCTVRLSCEIEGENRTYIWGIYQKRGAAEYAIVLESTYWKALQLYKTEEWDELANALHIANEWRDKVKEWFENDSNTFKQALVYMENREAKGQQIYTKVREIFSPLREIKFGDSERNDQNSRIAASIILVDQKGEDDRLNVHVWSLEVSGTDSFSDSTALEGGKLKPDGGELMYSTALRFYKKRHWAGLRNLFDIKRRGWNSVLQKIWQSESFGEVIEKRDDPRVFEELDKQLTGRVPDTSDALYTGEEAVQILREQSFDDWNHHCTVRLSCEIEGENRTYIWGLYQKRGAAEYAIVLESTYWKALQLYKQCKWDELVNALDIANEWRDKVKEWFENGSNTFKQVLEYMARREAERPQIYTKVKEIFSQLREIKSTERAASEGNLEMIATIILDCRKKKIDKKGKEDKKEWFEVHFWFLKGSRTAPTDSFGAKEVFKDGGLDPEKSDLVYSTALTFYKDKYWAGLRNLFDIDQTWWDTVLRKLLCCEQFEKVLECLKKSEANGETIYPQFNNIFSWTRVPKCKPKDVKVIIAGHDPLDNGKATGISFLIQGDPAKCSSIAKVFKSVGRNQYPNPFDSDDITHRCPYSWCEQGVLLLNAHMTIGKNRKHHTFGWEVITDEILKYFVSCTPYILLWGDHWNGRTGSLFQHLYEMEGRQATVIHNTHPSYGNRFIRETTGQDNDNFTGGNSGELHLFRRVNNIKWKRIKDGYPTIPFGVIHPEIGNL